MTIEKDNKTALKEAFDAELLKQLEENPPEIPSYEKFSSMIDGEVKKRRHRTRLISTAASIALLFLAGIATFSYFAPDTQADKNPKEEIITEDGVIIEDGGWGSSDGEDNVWVIEEWEDVIDARDTFPELIIPEHIPTEYKFEKLIIETVETSGTTCEYLFTNHMKEQMEIEIFVLNKGLISSDINNISYVIETTMGDLYIHENENKATIQIDGGTIVTIWGISSDDTIVEIVEHLKD